VGRADNTVGVRVCLLAARRDETDGLKRPATETQAAWTTGETHYTTRNYCMVVAPCFGYRCLNICMVTNIMVGRLGQAVTW